MISKRSLLRRSAAATVAASAALVLAACGNGNDASAGHNGHTATSPSASAPLSQGQHNAADVAFAKGMIPHHRQAIEMAGLAHSRAQSAEVKKLAEDTKKAQDPEIKTLSGWLTSWGEQAPAEGEMDHSVHGMAGMMSPQEMEKLTKNSSGAAFDTAFMELMIKHHEGAVEMAKTEKAQGVCPDAKTMADAIVTSQSAENEQMNKLLGRS
ncbi:lipoprotein [Streptomyces nojiriensis]|uniref:Lipoprotein n=1 Tax=Streptomyces nojiriensis TaxID=66374 RepID=A0ABQ3SDD9_9ACTN|nr:DUF305 domain-containing protein [Streptomyces nojiriensis]QTI42291.1 hypothetical protein JYK04_00048 [Streptomyces nojiriensis]GGS34732.1 lipoprotein [Streptomyces nojiriensis]GHI66143.1 lipoprotein [Streptomyces nojiriensis]